jgi:hypothetical protein
VLGLFKVFSQHAKCIEAKCDELHCSKGKREEVHRELVDICNVLKSVK